MCCEQLICARCAGRVSEARCPACRITRANLHEQGREQFPVLPLLIALTVVLYLVILAYVHTG